MIYFVQILLNKVVFAFINPAVLCTPVSFFTLSPPDFPI